MDTDLMVMARERLSQAMDLDTLMSTRADLTTMDPMATTSTIPMARGLPSPDMDMAMVLLTPTSQCTDPTPAMVSMSTIHTEKPITVKLRLYTFNTMSFQFS